MKLATEAFTSDKKLRVRTFYEYELRATGCIDNYYREIKSAEYRMSSNNDFIFVSSKNQKLYTVEKVENIPQLDNIRIGEPVEVQLKLEENVQIYEQLVTHCINRSLKKTRDLRKKYRTKYNNNIIGNYILGKDGKWIELKSEKGFSVKRKFSIDPAVNHDGSVVLKCMIGSEFSSTKTIYDLMEQGEDVVGIKVNYDWSNIGGYFTVEDVLDRTISEPGFMGQSLLEYFKNNNQEYRLKNIDEKGKQARVVKVSYGKKRYGDYIPQSLRPVITREYMAKKDSYFSKNLDRYIKMNMEYRYMVLKDFIEDIGEVDELDGLKFKLDSSVDLESLGYSPGYMEIPELIGESGLIKKKSQIFKNGFYKLPRESATFGVFFPEGYELETKRAIREIYDFCRSGKYQGEKSGYLKKSLLPIGFESGISLWETYPIGNITEYKRKAKMAREKRDIDFMITVVPDECEEENPYSSFKREWAEYGIPSQMVSLSTVNILNRSSGSTGLYYLHNISLGILGKLGGVPWIVRNMPGDVDCFIGIDVGTREKGIHFPACSVLFDKNGDLINYYKPKIPQGGEIIGNSILREVFDSVLLSYEDRYGIYPENIVIHRDGFSRESVDWYEDYFGEKGIKFNIVEVRKSGAMKFAELDGSMRKNPRPGTYIKSDREVLLVTTDIPESLGSPRPLKIEKTYGDMDIETLVKQIYYLSELHIGATKSTRLPITTGYADKICKMIDFIPYGRLDNRLFFL